MVGEGLLGLLYTLHSDILQPHDAVTGLPRTGHPRNPEIQEQPGRPLQEGLGFSVL